jgi:hypothetical protein
MLFPATARESVLGPGVLGRGDSGDAGARPSGEGLEGYWELARTV